GLGSLLWDTLKILLASGVMAGGLLLLLRYWDLSFAPFWPRLGFVFAMIGLGATLYFLAVMGLKVEGFQPLWNYFRRRLGGKP
ncbi:MAG: hypothetical protein R3257_06405, partial [bacterium]|nr:hypothetical protein [bacterium]